MLDWLIVGGGIHGTLYRRHQRFYVVTDRGVLNARRILVATGAAQSLCYPDWARRLAEDGAPIHHVFDDDFEDAALSGDVHVGICGLGISGAQLAARLVESGNCRITVVARHEVRVEQFDSDSCWLGPKCQVGFRRKSYRRRRSLIDEARNTGTMPRDVARRFERHCDTGSVTVEIGDVESASFADDDTIELQLDSDHKLELDSVVLATGFGRPRPRGDWLDAAARRRDLPRAPCGFPIVDRSLRWGEGLFVSGPLAELELGPASRNIAGARLAAKRLRSVPVV